MSIPDSSCGAQSSWWWDEANGDNNADGWTKATAVKSFAEIDRRWRFCPLSSGIVVNVVGCPEERPYINRAAGPGTLYFTGAQSVVGSGVIASVVQESMIANQACTITADASFPDGGWAAYLDKLIRISDANGNETAVSYVQKDCGGRTAQLGGSINIAAGAGNSWSYGTIAAGYTFAVIDHPHKVRGPVSSCPINIVYHGVGYHGDDPPAGQGVFTAQICEFDTRVNWTAKLNAMFSNLIACRLNGATLGPGTAGVLDRCYCPGNEIGQYSSDWRIGDLRFFGRASDPYAELVLIGCRMESIQQQPIGVDVGFFDVASGLVLFNANTTLRYFWGNTNGTVEAQLELRDQNCSVAFMRTPNMVATGTLPAGWRCNGVVRPWSDLVSARSIYDQASNSWIGYQTGVSPIP